MFIKEIFDGKSPDEFDEETITTINKFFENSLNVSETSRQLYIHRNTLVYRLDKLQKATGLDLRVFEDAITVQDRTYGRKIYEVYGLLILKICIRVLDLLNYLILRNHRRMEMSTMIKLEHVSKSYSAGIPALNDVNLNIEEGEFVFIVGDSGSGKSTLIKLLLKELEPTEGTITINGQKLNKIRRRQIPKFRRKIGVVFQDFRLLKDRNIYDNVAFAQKVIGESTRSIKKNVPLMLSMVGLAAKYRSYPKQLSGGEQQRVAIARALINQPKILFADEPTGNLDNNNAWEIMKLMEEINNNGTTVVVVTHNLEIVKAMNKRVITMQKGVIVDDSADSMDYELAKATGVLKIRMRISTFFLYNQTGAGQYLEK